MKKVVLTFFCLLGATILFIGFTSSSGGRAASANAGNTGAPGDATQTCVSCHGSAAFSVTQTIGVFDTAGNSVSAYVPGQEYEITVTNSSTGSPAGYGFQLVCLENDGNTNIGGWSNPGGNVQFATANGGREYAEHDGISSTNSFSLTWTAPAAGTGSVTLYASGNAVNNDGTTGGDGAATSTKQLNEQGNPAGVEETASLALSVFPNPTTDVIYLQHYTGAYHLYSLTGKELANGIANRTGTSLDLNEFPSGIYLLKLQNGKTERIVKR